MRFPFCVRIDLNDSLRAGQGFHFKAMVLFITEWVLAYPRYNKIGDFRDFRALTYFI